MHLKVLDAWSGHKHHTDTLSGGESFYVFLALALGLADNVTTEPGGQALDTLFIDEGFGTLDEDTLHQVLDELDSLRAHDRTVGLISHVPELRRRITQRLHISKNIDGSTLTHLTKAAERPHDGRRTRPRRRNASPRPRTLTDLHPAVGPRRSHNHRGHPYPSLPRR
ncbi:SbcC/MukB-like Walker B domain-containing protein [Streptomyces sp. NPDC059013]|uniref:SbcC/MukB-like Walker B domain-containing protein n=1 Tax=unclassified Streptomyces TaxID=2593676 RepID=UPI0036970FB5